jgi:Fe-S oxidoreductase
MLSSTEKIAFLLFAILTIAIGLRCWHRLYRRIARGRRDVDLRLDRLPERLGYTLATTLTQRRTFRKRPWISFFHSLIFYGFVFYMLVNLVDAAEGFVRFDVRSIHVAGAIYNLCADVLSALVLIGVVALVLRRFVLPSRRDFAFNERTMLHPDLSNGYVRLDSIIVSCFILFHVGSRMIGSAAKLAIVGPDRFQPLASILSHAFHSTNAEAWRVFGYWGALGSVLAFLAYFPRSKHIHLLMAPVKYFVARKEGSGVLPAIDLNLEAEAPQLGASKLEDLAWPRLLDAYACIQCNRCQDVCPATATGKALSPSALEINKRMELNDMASHLPGFEGEEPSRHPLLSFALSAEAAWACTTCGACIEVCPVQDEPMLDIIDIRRHQVMTEGEFPTQLQTAFRGMERSSNPWGINQDKRMDWADGLLVKTTDENPEPDVLFWVGCAASYDPQSQKTARAFVQLLDYAGVDFAVLGKKECCTGDSARRAGNEYLYRQLADQNVETLNSLKPKLIVATCPHCMNSIGKEYGQLGGEYTVMHHTEYLESLVEDGRLAAESGTSAVAFHDPCYLGRHNGVYDAPRNLLHIVSNSVVEMERSRENSFCCGAGGAQFWKEEEPGTERISDNRYAEAQRVLDSATDKVLAVGCPFCKSMLESTPGKGDSPIAVKDIAELLLEGVQRKAGSRRDLPSTAQVRQGFATVATAQIEQQTAAVVPCAERALVVALNEVGEEHNASAAPAERKRWIPKSVATRGEETEVPATGVGLPEKPQEAVGSPDPTNPSLEGFPKRKAWAPKRSMPSIADERGSDESK